MNEESEEEYQRSLLGAVPGHIYRRYGAELACDARYDTVRSVTPDGVTWASGDVTPATEGVWVGYETRGGTCYYEPRHVRDAKVARMFALAVDPGGARTSTYPLRGGVVILPE